MLRTLLESKALPTRRAGGTLISVGVHTAAIALAIATTARATAAPRTYVIRSTPVTYVAPLRPRESLRSRSNGSSVSGMVVPTIEYVDVPPIFAPTYVNTKPCCPYPSESWGNPTIVPSGLVARPGGLGSGTPDIYTTAQVEKAATPVASNPRPVYPAGLRAAQVEGSVTARFVVDTTGLAEPGSIAFPEASQAQFADAVREALLRSRYLPAMIGDRRVRQLVEQRFAFTLTR